MACLNSDGSLTPIARRVLTALQTPATVIQINQQTGIPYYRIRASLRELSELELLINNTEVFRITDKGRIMLEKSNNIKRER